jgi:hypothetical protein
MRHNQIVKFTWRPKQSGRPSSRIVCVPLRPADCACAGHPPGAAPLLRGYQRGVCLDGFCWLKDAFLALGDRVEILNPWKAGEFRPIGWSLFYLDYRLFGFDPSASTSSVSFSIWPHHSSSAFSQTGSVCGGRFLFLPPCCFVRDWVTIRSRWPGAADPSGDLGTIGSAGLARRDDAGRVKTVGPNLSGSAAPGRRRPA